MKVFVIQDIIDGNLALIRAKTKQRAMKLMGALTSLKFSVIMEVSDKDRNPEKIMYNDICAF